VMQAARRWPWAVAALVIGAYGIAVWSTFHTMPAFAPDTRYYAAMTLRLTGLSQAESYEQVKAFVEQFGYDTPGPGVLFGWGLVAPRIVYPALSVPFVMAFGIPGMQVVPVIAMGVGLLVTMLVGRRTAGLAATVAVLFLLIASKRLIFYGGAMLTESLSFAMVAGIALCLPWDGRRRSRRALLVALGLLLLVAFTRQATLIPAGAAVVAWIGSALRERRWRTAWAPFALWLSVVAVVVQVLQSILFPGFSQLTQFLLATKTDSLSDALAQVPTLTWTIITSDIYLMATVDIPLLILIVLAVIAGIVRWRHVDAHLLIGAVLATFLYNITNGTPTMFRYGFPGLVFVVVAVAYLLKSAVEQRLVPVSAVDPVATQHVVHHGVGRHAYRLGNEQIDTQRGQ